MQLGVHSPHSGRESQFRKIAPPGRAWSRIGDAIIIARTCGPFLRAMTENHPACFVQPFAAEGQFVVLIGCNMRPETPAGCSDCNIATRAHKSTRVVSPVTSMPRVLAFS